MGKVTVGERVLAENCDLRTSGAKRYIEGKKKTAAPGRRINKKNRCTEA